MSISYGVKCSQRYNLFDYVVQLHLKLNRIRFTKFKLTHGLTDCEKNLS